ncbi:MAG: iron-containing alcohol dehydrogenase, partial [Pseudomonadota bacterium]
MDQDMLPAPETGAASGVAPFAFATAAAIRFGWGEAAGAPAAVRALAARALAARALGARALGARALGAPVLLVHGARAERADWLARDLAAAGCTVARLATAGEPDVAAVEAGVDAARPAGAQALVALGGGPAIDLAKAVARRAPPTRPILDQ